MRLARGGGSVMALNVAGMAQALLLQVVLARLLGHEGYGQFAYVMAWINILVYVAVMGHDSLVMRSVAAYHARQEWALLAGTLRHAASLVGTLSIAISGAGRRPGVDDARGARRPRLHFPGRLRGAAAAGAAAAECLSPLRPGARRARHRSGKIGARRGRAGADRHGGPDRGAADAARRDGVRRDRRRRRADPHPVSETANHRAAGRCAARGLHAPAMDRVGRDPGPDRRQPASASAQRRPDDRVADDGRRRRRLRRRLQRGGTRAFPVPGRQLDRRPDLRRPLRARRAVRSSPPS